VRRRVHTARDTVQSLLSDITAFTTRDNTDEALICVNSTYSSQGFTPVNGKRINNKYGFVYLHKRNTW
jgi:hypothetical protein